MVEDADQVQSDADEDSDLQSQHETRDERRDPRYEVTLCQTYACLSIKPIYRAGVKPLSHHWFVNNTNKQNEFKKIIPIIKIIN